VTARWRLSGEFVVSCNCDVFCPCMMSLGKSRPTNPPCLSWFGYHIEDGEVEGQPVRGLNVVQMLEVPGRMEEGNWTVGIYFDERAGETQRAALRRLFTGQAGGPIGWTAMMVGVLLEDRVAPITYTTGAREWRFEIPRVLDGTVEAVAGQDGDGLVRVTNSRYWMAPDVIVCQGKRSRFRDRGRNWNLSGRSAEHARFEWTGP
jgi:hypothetical protein